MLSTTTIRTTENNMEDDTNGWDDDWDIESDDEVEEETNDLQQQQREEQPEPCCSTVKEEESVKELLIRYLKQVEDFTSSSLLKRNTNTMFSEEEALDLYAYYKERPELVNYTIDMEVPRMKYRLILSDGSVVTEVPEIQQVLRDVPSSLSMLIRASNQSILADVLPALSQRGLVWNTPTTTKEGPSTLLYQMCPIAKSCQFVLDLDANTLHVDCTLHVQLPILSSPLSEIRISIQFHPHIHFPTLSYQVVSTKSLIHPTNNHDQISSICQLLETEYSATTTTLPSPSSTRTPQKSSHGRRDDFIHQILQKNSLAVWNDIDAVVNVSSKLQFLKSSFLPNYQLEQQQQQQQQQQDTTTPMERPPSIVMGGFGFLSAGISKLVQNNDSTTTETNQYAFPRPPGGTAGPPTQNKLPPPPPLPTTEESQKFNTSQRRVPPPPPIQTRKGKTPTKVPLPPPPPVEESSMIEEDEDGWSFQDDEEDLDLPTQTPKVMTTSLTMDHAIQINHPNNDEEDDYYNVPKDFEYNPINGIIPTRKRFNPQSYRMLGFVKSQ